MHVTTRLQSKTKGNFQRLMRKNAQTCETTNHDSLLLGNYQTTLNWAFAGGLHAAKTWPLKTAPTTGKTKTPRFKTIQLSSAFYCDVPNKLEICHI